MNEEKYRESLRRKRVSNWAIDPESPRAKDEKGSVPPAHDSSIGWPKLASSFGGGILETNQLGNVTVVDCWSACSAFGQVKWVRDLKEEEAELRPGVAVPAFFLLFVCLF